MPNPDQSTEAGENLGNRPTGRLVFGVIRHALFSIEDEPGEAADDPFVANWDVEALKAEACEREQRGAVGAAQMLRNKARWLKPLLDPGGSKRKFYLWEVEGMDWPHLSVLSWMAQEDRKAMEVLSKKADNDVGQLARWINGCRPGPCPTSKIGRSVRFRLPDVLHQEPSSNRIVLK